MTLIYSGPCSVETLSHVCDSCGEFAELGGISGLAAVHKNYYDTLVAGLGDPLVWTTGIESGQIIIMSDTRGSMSSTPQYKAGGGRVKQRYTASDFKISVVDPAWASNHAMYSDLMLSSGAFYVAWVTETKLQISKKPATWKIDEPIEEAIDSTREWKMDVEFTQRGFSVPVAIPDGIFECFTID